MQSKLPVVIFVFIVCYIFSIPVSAQLDTANHQLQINSQLNAQIDALKMEVSQLRIQMNNLETNLNSKVTGYSSIGLVLLLCGGFCALWAQDSGRNPWVWFFFGCFFPFLAVIVLLMKNSDDIRKQE